MRVCNLNYVSTHLAVLILKLPARKKMWFPLQYHWGTRTGARIIQMKTRMSKPCHFVSKTYIPPPPSTPGPVLYFWDRLKIVYKIWSSLSHLTDFILHEYRLKAPCQFFLLGFWGRHSTAFTLGWVGSWGHNSVAAAKRQEAPLLTHSAACPPPGRMKKYNCAVGASAKFACILISLNLN